MCTLTAVPTPGGVRVAFNRDESPARPAALPPAALRTGDARALVPVDPESGGTWLAATDAGLVLALLNANPVAPPPRRPTRSRGGVIPAVLDAPSPWDAVFGVERALDVHECAPFRLVAIDRDSVADFHWNGREATVGSHLLGTGPALFTSSGLGDHRVTAVRGALFRDLFAGSDLFWPAAQDAFHRHRWAERPELSVNMARPGARTVSFALIELGATAVRFRYHPAAPHEPAATSEHALPLAARVPR